MRHAWPFPPTRHNTLAVFGIGFLLRASVVLTTSLPYCSDLCLKLKLQLELYLLSMVFHFRNQISFPDSNPSENILLYSCLFTFKSQGVEISVSSPTLTPVVSFLLPVTGKGEQEPQKISHEKFT